MAVEIPLAYLKTEPIEHLRSPKGEKEEVVARLMQDLADFAHEALDADACSVFLVDEQVSRAVQVAGTGYQKRFAGTASRPVAFREEVEERPAPGDRLGIAGWIISTGLPFLARTPEELQAHPHHRGDYDQSQLPDGKLQIQTFLGVPIRGLQQKIRGLVKAERRQKEGVTGKPFSAQDEIVLSNIAAAAGRCLDYLIALALENKPQHAITAWTSDVISVAAGAEPDLPSFVNVVAEVIAVAAGAESCSVFLIDDNGDYLTQVGGYGYQAKGNLIRSYRMPPPNTPPERCGGLTAYIACSGNPVYARDAEALREHPAWKGKFDPDNFIYQQQCEAFLGLPIQIGARVIGVLKLENSTPKTADPFPPEIQRNVSVQVQSLALALVNLRVREATHYGVIETATETINKIFREGGDVPELVSRAIKEFSTKLNAEACALFIKEGDKLVQHDWGCWGYATRMKPGTRREYDWRSRDKIKEIPRDESEKVGLTVWIAAVGDRFVAGTYEQLKNHPHHLGTYDPENFKKDERCDSFMGFSLKVGGKPIGVIKIENKTDPRSGRHVAFTKEDELGFRLLASSLANAIYFMRGREEDNLANFVQTRAGQKSMWALGLRNGRKGLQAFDVDLPPLPDDAVLVRTHYLGICGTDIHSFGGNNEGKFDLIEFHEALGEVAWTGPAVDERKLAVGDIVVPVVRRCQEWDQPTSPDTKVTFDFRPCKEAARCQYYRKPDSCPKGEYPHLVGTGADKEYIGYRSRGTGKCHGFGSQYFVDTPEWLIRVCTRNEIQDGQWRREFLSRLILVEPLAVVWKMKREIEHVRPVRPFQDRILTLGMGPIGYLATFVMCSMYPGLHSTAVDRVSDQRQWIRQIREDFHLQYKELAHHTAWHAGVSRTNGLFDIVVEATGQPQDVIQGAIDVLAPNGILVLLSVVGKEGDPSVFLDGEALNAIVKKNARIIGSVNESIEDFENAIDFLKRFHGGVSSSLDHLINEIPLDPPRWDVIEKVREIKNEKPWERVTEPKIVLKAADFNVPH